MGSLAKAILLFYLFVFAYLLLAVFNIATSFYGYIGFFLFTFSIRLYAAIDAVRGSLKRKEYQLTKYNTLKLYLPFGLLSAGIPAAIVFGGLMGTQLFHIPSDSNSPTIRPGDYVMMDKRAYDNNNINYGDIVGYNSVREGAENVYDARVVGLPNDKITIKDDVISINGVECTYRYIRDISLRREKWETLPNGFKHHIYVSGGISMGPESLRVKNYEVPAGCYFLMGDNRDFSYNVIVKKETL